MPNLQESNRSNTRFTIKAVYWNPNASIVFNGEKLEAFLLISGIWQRYPLSAPLFSKVLKVLTRSIRQEKEMKIIEIRNNELKLSICRLHDSTHRKTRRLCKETIGIPKRVRQSSRIQNHELGSVVLVYTNNPMSEKQLISTTSLK